MVFKGHEARPSGRNSVFEGNGVMQGRSSSSDVDH